MNQHLKRYYEFGPFSLDTGKRLLLHNGEPVPLAPKILETLLVLVENRTRVLAKDELLQRVWGDTSVEEGGLTRNISILRKTLGERPEDHQYIVTRSGLGYQFVADVRERLENGAEFSSQGVDGPESQRDFRPRRARRVYRWLGFGGLSAVALGILYLAIPGRTTNSTRPEIKSLAVLPVENLSGDPTQEYFADGMTEALISSLAQIRALRVVSRTSAMTFKDSKKPLPEIAEDLKVDAVVETSVQRENGRVEITVQLIHAPTDTHLWARHYDRELVDILKLQSEVASAVADEIRIQLTGEERARLASATTVNPEAYEEYLIGRYHLWKFIEEDLILAIQHFERAIQIDPKYAASYAGLSYAWCVRGIFGTIHLKNAEAPARAAVRKALELDDRIAEAYAVQGYLQCVYDWNCTGAETTTRRALELDPNNAEAHYIYALLLMAMGRSPEAITQIRSAELLDPLSAQVHSTFGRILYRARKFDEAVLHLNRALELEPRNFGTLARLGDVYDEMGRYTEAVASFEKIRALAGRLNPDSTLRLARVYARMGRRSEARQILKDSKLNSARPPLISAAGVYAALGDKDAAFSLLFRNLEERSGLVVYIKHDPPFDSLHSDPRWKELLHRINLPIE